MDAAVHADTRYLRWRYGKAGVSAFGGVTGPCAFNLSGGAEARPFHRAPRVAEGDIAVADGLSPDLARSTNPITVAGTPTCLNLSPETPMTIRCRIREKDLT